jgi:hypothetical protein
MKRVSYFWEKVAEKVGSWQWAVGFGGFREDAMFLYNGCAALNWTSLRLSHRHRYKEIASVLGKAVDIREH